MGSYMATWEDEEHNRHIQFSVHYRAENGSIEIAGVTPTKVSFICPDTNTCLRAIRVHTETGRRILAEYFHKVADLNSLVQEISQRAPQPAIA